jgi:hypothetical protein
MIARPILRPIPCLRATCRSTDSLTGKTWPARSRAIWNAGNPLVRRSLGVERGFRSRFGLAVSAPSTAAMVPTIGGSDILGRVMRALLRLAVQVLARRGKRRARALQCSNKITLPKMKIALPEAGEEEGKQRAPRQ